MCGEIKMGFIVESYTAIRFYYTRVLYCACCVCVLHTYVVHTTIATQLPLPLLAHFQLVTHKRQTLIESADKSSVNASTKVNRKQNSIKRININKLWCEEIVINRTPSHTSQEIAKCQPKLEEKRWTKR